MSTPHIRANKDAIAERILLPGDPMRAKYIADRFLQGAACVNDVRGMLGYTGTYNGIPVSVMGTGMGVPSASIYITELLDVYGARALIRVGTCGSYKEDVQLNDLILGMGACTDSGVLRRIFPGDYAPTADFLLLCGAYDRALKTEFPVHVGLLKTTDRFYSEPGIWGADNWGKYGVLGVEMAAAALYTLAAKYGGRALAMCVVAEGVHAMRSHADTGFERAMDNMIAIALETITTD